MSSLYRNWACAAPELQMNIPANRMVNLTGTAAADLDSHAINGYAPAPPSVLCGWIDPEVFTHRAIRTPVGQRAAAKTHELRSLLGAYIHGHATIPGLQ